MTVSAEGRVENQKLNQAAALLSFGWVFGFQLDSLEKHLITLVVVTFTYKNEQNSGIKNFWSIPVQSIRLIIYEL